MHLEKYSFVMLYYTVRDIGSMNEIESFISNAVPTQQSVSSVLNQFPEFSESPTEIPKLPILQNESSDVEMLPFPHVLVAIVGHAGSGKTYILKHIANRKRTMFYAPTNPAGINLQMTLWPAMLFTSGKKKVYRTIHSFYHIQPSESNILGQCVMRARQCQSIHPSYSDYLNTMFKGCKPFCEKLFAKEISAEKFTPQVYQEYRCKFLSTIGLKPGEYLHEKVIEYIYSLGLGAKIPDILLYDCCVLEEAGRTSDYLAFLFIFYWYFMHIKYRTYAWHQKLPSMIFVGSPTQSRVIDDFTPWSALTFAGQPCMKEFISNTDIIKFKSFKDNRRVTSGNIENNTTLASVISKLELGLSVTGKLKEKFNSVFVTEEANFFDPLYRSKYFRIAKKHEHLKIFKSNVFLQNEHNMIDIPEYFLTNEDVPFFKHLAGLINVKCKSETYEDMWVKTSKKTKVLDQEYHAYHTTRKCLKGFRYLLIEYHSLYIHSFYGTIQQFVEVTDSFQPYMSNERSNCIQYFVNCAKYILESIYSDPTDQILDGVSEFMKKYCADDFSMQHLMSLKTLLQHATENERYKDKIFSFANEEYGTCIILPKDMFSFLLVEIDVKKKHNDKDLDSVCAYLEYNNCIMFKMFQKLKSISTNEVTSKPETTSQNVNAKPNFHRFKRKWDQCEQESNQEEDIDINENISDMTDMMNKLANKSFFKVLPIVLHIGCTIDSTQGLTIHSPILALLKKEDRAEDFIVALSRTSNPDMLLVANNVFNEKYESIAFETKNLIKIINKAQRKDGWL